MKTNPKGSGILEEEIYIATDKSNNIICMPLIHGLKIEVRDTILDQIQENQFIKDNFQLNIRRLNRWWYSIYFDKKCNHTDTTAFGDDVFCLKCGKMS
jgi:hypothetical protein